MVDESDQSDQIDEGPGEHDTHLMDDDPSDTVLCPRCGKYIWAYAQKCHQCGVNFSGEAWQFEPRNDTTTPRGRLGMIVVALVIIALLVWLWL